MEVTLNILSPKSVNKAAASIRKYAEKLKRLEEELPKVLCEYGVEDAQMRFDYAVYDIYGGMFGEAGTGGGTDVEVSLEEMEDGYAVVANGEKVCFVEFGAGVYYNGGGESYLGERPDGVVGIGEYGQGKGKRKSWFFTDEFGVTHMSRGTPASNALYFTTRDMADRVVEEARRILND